MARPHVPNPAPARCSGFTLIELIVVITILSILAMVALPAYTEHVARARRADARTQLIQVAQFMQRFYAANDTFQVDRAGNAVATQVPSALRRSPPDGTAAVYTLEIPAGTLSATSFEIRMVPVAGGPMAQDRCGSFSLNALGVRAVLVAGTADTGALRDTCWR